MDVIASDNYVVVIGLGVTGLSVLRYLSRTRDRIYAMDTRESLPGLDEIKKSFPNVRISLGELDGEVILNAKMVVVSPGVSRSEPAIAKAIQGQVKVTGDVELFLEQVNGKVIGVTGSNGKSTVVTILGQVACLAGLKAVVGGNIGVPVLDLLEGEADVFILELSSFQLESIRQANLYVACILNITRDHMDRYSSLESYFSAKQRIYYGADNVVYNLDDKLTIPPQIEGTCRSGFSLCRTSEENEQQYWFDSANKKLMKNSDPLMHYSAMRTKGLHNVANALAVFAICEYLGIKEAVTSKVLAEFPGLPHRCQWIGKINGITFVNDSKATNVGATEAAILGLKDDYETILLIAGGDAKGADFSSLAQTISEYVDDLILMGRDIDKIASAVGNSVSTHRVLNMQSAVKIALELAGQGSLVLLSPACASFDMYSGYEERGKEFIDSVDRACA